MDNTTQLMELYSTCFTLSMVITIIAAALAVFLFFRFNIRGIYAIRSGKAKQREIREMEERNQRTGKLREDSEFDFDSTGSRDNGTVKTGPTKSSGRRTARSGKTGSTGGRKSGRIRGRTGSTGGTAKQPQQPSSETAVLGGVSGAEHHANDTLPLSEPLQAKPVQGFRFDITEYTAVVHTDEIIE